jgi:hypothetical protein
VEAAAAGQPQDIDWLDRYVDNPHNEMLAVHERAEARVAGDSDGGDSGVQLTVSVATNILTSNDQNDKCTFLGTAGAPPADSCSNATVLMRQTSRVPL